MQDHTLTKMNIPMNQPRAFFKATLSQDLRHIYCVGGVTTKDKPISSVEKYDVFAQTWEILSPMFTQRSKMAMLKIKS